MKVPAVSIIVPSYNQAHFLKECLDSIAAQTFTDWEVIVVDDASSDGKAIRGILAEYDSRFRLILHTTNRGLAASRNTGIASARAEWVLPVDADDRLSPHFLGSTMKVVEQTSTVDAVFTDHLCFGEMNYIKHRYVQTAEEILDHHSIPGAGTIYRRSLWEGTGGYCETPIFRAGNEDWDFWLSVYEKGFTPFHIPEPLYEYRRYQGSMVSRLQAVDYKVRLLMYYRHRNLFDRYKKRSQFLSKGFENSALSVRKQGRFFRSGMLALFGFFLNINNRKLARLSLDSLVSVLHLTKFFKLS